MIFMKYDGVKKIFDTEPKTSKADMTVPGQAYTVDELLRRAQNGTFPDINFYHGADYEGDAPEENEVYFNDTQDFIDALDVSQASEMAKDISTKIKRSNIKNK